MRDNTDTPFCEKCRFWEAMPHLTEDGDRGECRRNTPRVLSNEDEFGVFPITLNDTWCGEYRRKDFSA